MPGSVLLAEESFFLVVAQVQILLQRRGLSLNPITTMYYIAPASFAFLSIPWAVIEARRLFADSSVKFDPLIFISNAAAAFGLNMSVFLLIGKTSALTMNVAGVIKDWMLIGLSVLLFHAEVGPPGEPAAAAIPCWEPLSRVAGALCHCAASASACLL